MSYEASYYSSTVFTISGSGDITDEFHPGREVEYATITGSTTYSGISTPTVTNSGVTLSGTAISGSLTVDYYDYDYGIVESSTYSNSTVYVTVTPESDTVLSGSPLYVKYGTGQVGLDDTFPSTSDSGTVYKLNRLKEYVGDLVVSGTLSADKITTGILDTNQVKVSSSDGKTYMDGNTIYVYDDNDVLRVKMGSLS